MPRWRQRRQPLAWPVTRPHLSPCLSPGGVKGWGGGGVSASQRLQAPAWSERGYSAACRGGGRALLGRLGEEGHTGEAEAQEGALSPTSHC